MSAEDSEYESYYLRCKNVLPCWCEVLQVIAHKTLNLLGLSRVALSWRRQNPLLYIEYAHEKYACVRPYLGVSGI